MTTAFAWPYDQHPAAAPAPSDAARPAVAQGVGLRSPRSWAELVYVVIDLVPSILFLVLPVTLLAVGLGLAVIYVGVPLLALGLLVARFGGMVQRTMALALLGLPSAAPGWREPRRPGPISALTAVLRDGVGWRAVGYFVIKLALAPVTFAVAVAFYAAGLGALTYPVWHGYLPEQAASDGSLHRGMQWWPDFFVDGWASMAVLALIGAGILWCAPRVVGFLTTIDRMLIAALL
ncbi:sensor domain-containing protein [Nakamurella sp. GG22]